MNRLPLSLDPTGDFKNCYIAGGAVLSCATKTDISDYDVYPKNHEGLMTCIDVLMADGYCTNISDRALTFKYNGETDKDGNRIIVQVMIYDFFNSPEQIFENFDFTVCMAAWDADTSEYTFHPDFYPDATARTLRFNPKTKFPLNSMLRVAKYRSKGYFISKPENVKIALAVASQGLPETWEDLERQIGGTYGHEIKLHAQDKEFNLENMYDLLSSMEWKGDFDLDKKTQIEDLKSNVMMAFFGEGSKFFKYDDHGSITDERYFVYDPHCNEIHNVDVIVEETGCQYKFSDSVGCQGYVFVQDGYLMTNAFGYSVSSVSKSDIEYGDDAVEGVIEVFMKKPTGWRVPKDVSIAKVSFDTKDINDILDYKKIKIGKGYITDIDKG